MTSVLVCGGRDFMHPIALIHMLDMYHHHYDISELIHGGARGADSMAERWAEKRDIPMKVFPAQWDKYGKSAGYVRNKQMLVEGKPIEIIAFPGGKGTNMMIQLALDSDYSVWIVKICPENRSLFNAKRYQLGSDLLDSTCEDPKGIWNVQMYNTTRGGSSYNGR